MTRRIAKGMTLVEVIMALGITIVAVAIASSLVLQGAYMTRQGEETANNNDASRFAGDLLASSLMSAGLGAPDGLFVALQSGLSSHRVLPVMAVNNPACTQPAAGVCPDELWVVVPHRNALRNPCVDTGGGVMVQKVFGGALELRCGPSFTGFSVLMATNMVRGALLSNPTIDLTGTWPRISAYDELGNGYSNAPDRGGFQVGDVVFPVTLVHYYVANIDNGVPGDLVGDAAKLHTPANPAPSALWSRQGKVAAAFAAGAVPFTDVAASQRLVQSDIEDLQLAFGFDSKGQSDPNDIVYGGWDKVWSDAFRPNLRSVRVNVVSKSVRRVLNSSGEVNTSTLYKPVVVEDHAPSTTPDGYSRNFYRRRVDLPNMAPGNI